MSLSASSSGADDAGATTPAEARRALFRPASLKRRLLWLFALFLGLVAAGGAAVMTLNAREAVRAEMVSALELAAALAQQSDHVTAQGLNNLGLRHIRARAGDAPDEASPRRETADAPAWFTALIGVEPLELRITKANPPETNPPEASLPETVTLIAEPHDEVAEVWNDLVDLAFMAAALSLAAVAALAFAVDRALSPLATFEQGLDRLAAGEYAFRPSPGGPPELARLGARIAALAAALRQAQAENRRLGARLVAAQDDERRQLARDLHDELGATLFAVKVDAGRVAQLAATPPADPPADEKQTRDRQAALTDCAARIIDAADHLNSLGRSVMTRLRPPLLDQLTLSEALNELTDAGRRRRPELEWRLDLAGPLDELADSHAVTIYRLVQEGLTNAQRHGAPRRIRVSATADPDAGVCTVRIRDDGGGIDPDATAGTGLAGLAERVQILGGALSVVADGGETALTAAWPCVARSNDKG